MLHLNIGTWPTPYPDMHLPKNVTTRCSVADRKHCDWSAWWTCICSYVFLAPSCTILLHTFPARANMDQVEERLIKVLKYIKLYDSSLSNYKDGQMAVNWCGQCNCRVTLTCRHTNINVFKGIGHMCSLRRTVQSRELELLADAASNTESAHSSLLAAV